MPRRLHWLNLVSDGGNSKGAAGENPEPDSLLGRGNFVMLRLRSASHPLWRELSAVKQGRVVMTDGNQYFNRPGPRVVESAEILSELLHPGRFDFGHRGSGWRYWNGHENV